jgi:hypothetical protein
MPSSFATARILAISDVNLTAPNGASHSIARFYSDCIGLEPVGGDPDGPLRFRGYRRSGPQLIVRLTDEPIAQFPRRQALIEVGSLTECADGIAEHGIEVAWSRGWFHFDRRLTAADPAGNLVELIAQHPL